MTSSLDHDLLAVTLFSEVFMVDQLARTRFGKLLPKGMELSHFTVLNHLAHSNKPRTPAELAKNFNLTRGAMTNTLNKLDWAGHVHINPDWDDARRKQVVISPAGRTACETAIAAITPLLKETFEDIGTDRLSEMLPFLVVLRFVLG